MRFGRGVSEPRRENYVSVVDWFLIVVGLVLAPTVVAQGIVGTVKDASGAVLPGVTVEASSPALIEKTRSVVTNGVSQLLHR